MKKIIIITLAAFAALALLSAATPSGENLSDGVVRFESTSAPALNFSMGVSRAQEIFRLLPESLSGTITSEYTTIKEKCRNSSRFIYEGVTVSRAGTDPDLTFTFSFQGYTLSVSGVSWAELDGMFLDNPRKE
ncbi:MAG: hypothetical protein IJV54_13875 [Bacteroidales bacterium]|nr:hypothetical protein [Bacteroidales bacterium]